MCGIAGTHGQPDGDVLVKTMVGRLGHRGPDASGIRDLTDEHGSTVLGHTRLSIIDLSHAADQPFVKDGLTLTYNGELYNYRELRHELEAVGTRFATSSDTEVVLEACRAWGTAALGRFRGMFALALHDERSGDLMLARDPFGIKPLHVLRRGGGVVFASEAKAIVAAVGDELTVDPAGMVAAALYYWVPPDQDVLRGVRKFPAGTWAVHHRDGSHETGVFWDPVAASLAAAQGPAPDLGRVLEESVAAHMVADVPVATFLSGGLDSSIVTALAHRHQPDLTAYSIAFRAADQRLEAMPDDARYARLMAEHLGITLHEIEISPDIVDMLPQVVDVLDEPIGDPAALNTLLMCRAARDEGVKVLLSGMGADELFGGYRKHLACLVGTRYQQVPAPLRNNLVGPLVRRLPVMAGGRGIRVSRWAQRFLTFAELGEEEAFRRSYTLYDLDELTGLLDPALSGVVEELLARHRATYEDNALDDHVARMCLADTRLFMQGLNLAYTDRASMAASCEVRVPFVDTEVFTAAFALSARDRIRGRVQKAALKEAGRAWVPDAIVDRPKASFGAPLRAWVTRDLRELIDDTLVGGELVASGFLRPEPLRQLVADQRSGRRDTSKQLWTLLTLEMWYRSARAAGIGAA